MKIWQVIFATMVIFAAGVVTGTLISRNNAPPPQPPPRRQQPAPAAAPVPAWIVQDRFLQLLKRELALSPQQVTNLHAVFADSRERMQVLMDLINPELQAEKREVADRIRAELTEEQKTKFEQLVKRPHRPEPGDRARRRGTNAPSATN